jgi:hypothetical protein
MRSIGIGYIKNWQNRRFCIYTEIHDIQRALCGPWIAGGIGKQTTRALMHGIFQSSGFTEENHHNTLFRRGIATSFILLTGHPLIVLV